MKGNASGEDFVFEVAVLSSTRRPTTVKNLVAVALQHTLTPSFITVDILALVVPCLFAVCFVPNNDDFLGQPIAAMMRVMSVRLY